MSDQIPGDKPKRYHVSYGGQIIGWYDTAREAWAGYRDHDERIRRYLDPKKKYRYAFHEGRKEEFSIERFRAIVQSEKQSPEGRQ